MASVDPQQAPEGRRQRVVLIGCDAGTGRPALCHQLVRCLLELGEFDVAVHVRDQRSNDLGSQAVRDPANRTDTFPPAPLAHLRVFPEPLEQLLPNADIFVSGGREALVLGCRAGLKPVQIGGMVEGSGKFSHVFPDFGSFVAAAAKLRGELSLEEYESFCCSALGVAASEEPPLGALAKLCEVLKGLSVTISNPVAVLRFVRTVVSEWWARSG